MIRLKMTERKCVIYTGGRTYSGLVTSRLCHVAVASSFLLCCPGCVGSSTQDGTYGPAAPSSSSLQGWIQRPRKGFPPHASLFKKAETFLEPPCSPPSRLSLHLTGQNLQTLPGLRQSREGNRVAVTVSHSHNTLPGRAKDGLYAHKRGGKQLCGHWWH